MAAKNVAFLVTLMIAICLITGANNAIAARHAIDDPMKHAGYNITARIKASGGGGGGVASGGEGGGLVDCWNALVELKSCSNEIVLFFLNGQADIGPDCCKGIAIITRHCWPTMLTSLGFTAEEGSILRGYCDAAAAATNTSAAPASPPLAAAAAAAHVPPVNSTMLAN